MFSLFCRCQETKANSWISLFNIFKIIIVISFIAKIYWCATQTTYSLGILTRYERESNNNKIDQNLWFRQHHQQYLLFILGETHKWSHCINMPLFQAQWRCSKLNHLFFFAIFAIFCDWITMTLILRHKIHCPMDRLHNNLWKSPSHRSTFAYLANF